MQTATLNKHHRVFSHSQFILTLSNEISSSQNLHLQINQWMNKVLSQTLDNMYLKSVFFHISHIQLHLRLVDWVLSSRTVIVVISKARAFPPTFIFGDQGDPLVVRPGFGTEATYTGGKKLSHRSELCIGWDRVATGWRCRISLTFQWLDGNFQARKNRISQY